MTAPDAGPILAEEEMLHDGEPVFSWGWGESACALFTTDEPAPIAFKESEQ